MEGTTQIEKLADKLTARSLRISRHHAISQQADLTKIDRSVIIAIYLIENHFRPFYIRTVEYSLLIHAFIANRVVARPIKNYTVGRFQIGLTSILRHGGYAGYKVHDRTITKLSLSELLYILSRCSFYNNLVVCCQIVRDFTDKIELEWGTSQYNAGRIGEKYNGKKSYGFLLLEIAKRLNETERRLPE